MTTTSHMTGTERDLESANQDPICGAPAGQQVYSFGEFLPSDGM